MYKSVNVAKKVSIRNSSEVEERREGREEGRSIETRSMNMPSDKKAAYNQEINKEQYSIANLRSKFKTAVIISLRNVLKGNSIPEDAMRNFQMIDSAPNIDQLIQRTVQLISSAFLIHKARQDKSKGQTSQIQNSSVLKFPIRVQETRMLRLVREDSAPNKASSSRFQELESYNDSLRKEIFELKEEKQQLQRRMLELIEQYKNRKGFYLAEIKKLTDIITMSSLDVRTLVLQKTKQAREYETKKDQSRMYEPEINSGMYNEHKRANHYTTGTPRSPRKDRSLEEHSSKAKGYNTQIRMLKGINSVEHFQEVKNDSNLIY